MVNKGLALIIALAVAPAIAIAQGTAPPSTEDTATPKSSQERPIVFIVGTGNTDIRTNGSAVGGWGWIVGSSESTVSQHNQTMELAKDFMAKCSAVTVTLDSGSADYGVALNHEAFHGYIHKNNQIIVANRRRNVVMSTTTHTVSDSVTKACSAILADWDSNGRLAPLPGPPPAPTPAPTNSPSSQLQSAETHPIQGTTLPQALPDEQSQSLGDAARAAKAKKAAQAAQIETPRP